ncbi:hypothetical protein HDU87_000775 [Geranomyces variabilis]|uniref:Uncharacterized protein n=1 Tax=Geranomyces variabilis TaxID=109894 RepID=A0AAD5TQH2_9FUNG|nr:hypothetical protein HDU87_000775 [Geranomyces variabilis]
MTSDNKPPEPRLYLWGLPISKGHSLLSESLHLVLKHKYKRLHAVHLYHGSDRAHISYTDEEKLKQDVRAAPRTWNYDHKGNHYEVAIAGGLTPPTAFPIVSLYTAQITGVPKLAKIGVLAVMGVPKSVSVNSTWHLPAAPWAVQSRISNDVLLTEALTSLFKILETRKAVTIDSVRYKVNKVEMPATNGDDDTESRSRTNGGTVGSAPASEPTIRRPSTTGSDISSKLPSCQNGFVDAVGSADTSGALEDPVEIADDSEDISDGMQALFNELQDENDALHEGTDKLREENDMLLEENDTLRQQDAWKEDQMERMRAQMARMGQENRQKQSEFAERLSRKDAEIAMLHSFVGDLERKFALPPPPCTKCVTWEGVAAQQADMVIALQQKMAKLRAD